LASVSPSDPNVSSADWPYGPGVSPTRLVISVSKYYFIDIREGFTYNFTIGLLLPKTGNTIALAQ